MDDIQIFFALVQKTPSIMLNITQTIDHTFAVLASACDDSKDTIFWFFSSTSQTNAAILGFLVAAYTFFSSSTELQKNDDDDEQLSTIKTMLHKRQFRYLLALLIIGMTSISSSLSGIILTKNPTSPFKMENYLLYSSFSTLVFLIYSIIFSANSFSKKSLYKYMNAVATKNAKLIEAKIKETLHDDKSALSTNNKHYNLGLFLTKFIEIETLLISMYKHTHKKIHQTNPSVRYAAEQLLKNKSIDENTFEELLNIIRYRNYAAHGRIEEISKSAIDSIDNILKILQESEIVKLILKENKVIPRQCYDDEVN